MNSNTSGLLLEFIPYLIRGRRDGFSDFLRDHHLWINLSLLFFNVKSKIANPRNPSVTKDKQFVAYVTQGFSPAGLESPLGRKPDSSALKG